MCKAGPRTATPPGSFGQMSDVDSQIAVSPTVSPSEAPSEDQPPPQGYRKHLGASQVPAFMGFEDQSSWHRGKSRFALVEEWAKPRTKPGPPDDGATRCRTCLNVVEEDRTYNSGLCGLCIELGGGLGGSPEARQRCEARKAANLESFKRPNPRCAHGIATEPKAIEAYCRLMRLEPEQVQRSPPFREHPVHRWLGAAPDALVTLNDPETTRIVEVKCPTSLLTDPDKMVYPEASWLLQIYIQLECFPEAASCDLVVYNGSHLWLWRIHRDPDVTSPRSPHVPYKVEVVKRDAEGMTKTSIREDPPVRLMGAMMRELGKYCLIAHANASGVPLDPSLLRADPVSTERIKIEFSAWRKFAVTQLAITEGPTEGLRWVTAFPGEKRTSPFTYTYIDRFYLPISTGPPGLYHPFAERLLNVRWLDGRMTDFWEYDEANPDKPYPRGGFIRTEYFPVKKSVDPSGNLTEAHLTLADMALAAVL